MTIAEPRDDALELCLSSGGTPNQAAEQGLTTPAAPPSGAQRVAGAGRRAAGARASLRLERLLIAPCEATEVKASRPQ